MASASSGSQYTRYYRDMISQGCIDTDQTELGTELQIVWGETGTQQKRIRAVVSRFPCLDLTPHH